MFCAKNFKQSAESHQKNITLGTSCTTTDTKV